MALHEKWFEYEAQVLVPFISNGPLIFWLYPLFGIRGAIWFLGVYEGSGSPRDINLFAETGRDASNQGANPTIFAHAIRNSASPR